MIVGHRGAGRGVVDTSGGTVSENTIASFMAAHDAGAHWVETDAVRTADSHLVLHHDTVLEDGTPIESLTLQEVRAAGLDTLEEAFNSLPVSLGIIVELKHVLSDAYTSAPGTAALLGAALLQERSRSRRSLLTYGFDASTPLALPQSLAAAGIGVGVIAEGGTDLAAMLLSAHRLGATVVAAHTSSLLGPRAQRQLRPFTLEAVITTAHRLGLEVMGWCPSLEEARLLAAAGLDALCVDDVPAFMPAWRQ